MGDVLHFTAEGLRVLLRRMVGTHGKDAAVAWLREEWLRQPAEMFDCFIMSDEPPHA